MLSTGAAGIAVFLTVAVGISSLGVGLGKIAPVAVQVVTGGAS